MQDTKMTLTMRLRNDKGNQSKTEPTNASTKTKKKTDKTHICKGRDRERTIQKKTTKNQTQTQTRRNE